MTESTTTNQTQRPTTKQLPTVSAMLRYEDGGWWLVFRGTCPSPQCPNGHVVLIGEDIPDGSFVRRCGVTDYEVRVVGIETDGHKEPEVVGDEEAVPTLRIVRGR